MREFVIKRIQLFGIKIMPRNNSRYTPPWPVWKKIKAIIKTLEVIVLQITSKSQVKTHSLDLGASPELSPRF